MSKNEEVEMKKVVVLVLILTFVTGCQDINHIDANEKIEHSEKSVSFAEIESASTSWKETYKSLQSNYNTAITQEFAEHGYAHDLNVEYMMSENIYNRGAKEFIVPNSIIDRCIDTNWNAINVENNIDTSNLFRLYSYNKLDHYRAKNVNNQIDHIIFEGEYRESILEGISLGMDLDMVKTLFGDPDYSCPSINLQGYLFDEFYMFVIGEDSIQEVSIYSRSAIGKEELLSFFATLSEGEYTNFEELNGILATFEYNLGISSKNIYGYEKSGVILALDMNGNIVNISIFDQARDIDLTRIMDKDNVNINNYKERDAIVELEIYRVYIEKYLLGENIEPSISLGMAFQSQESIIYSPERDYVVVFNGDSADDNYPAIYVLSIKDNSVRKEIVVDTPYKKIYWLDNDYLIYEAENVSFIYDIHSDKIIPVTQDIFGNEYIINSIENNTINFTSKKSSDI